MVDKKLQNNIEQDYKKAKDYLDLHIKLEPGELINLEHIKIESDWDFFYNNKKMLSSKELDSLIDKIKTNRLPDMFFGYNRFYIANAKHNFVLQIDPIEMVDLCLFNERNGRFINIKENNEIKINSIYFIPNEIKVQFWDKWKNIKVDRTDIQKKDPTSDWTYTTAYMGDIRNLNTHKIFEGNSEIFKSKYDHIDFEYNNKENQLITVVPTDEELPLDKLGRDNPILNYIELNLFDDELNDNGLAQGNFR